MKRITEIGAAVVGTGFIGVVHVEALRRLGVRVPGVFGSSHERASARSHDAGVPPAYQSFEEMLADPRVEVVHITTPNHLHHAQTKAAIAAGKHVIGLKRGNGPDVRYPLNPATFKNEVCLGTSAVYHRHPASRETTVTLNGITN